MPSYINSFKEETVAFWARPRTVLRLPAVTELGAEHPNTLPSLGLKAQMLYKMNFH